MKKQEIKHNNENEWNISGKQYDWISYEQNTDWKKKTKECIHTMNHSNKIQKRANLKYGVRHLDEE